MTGWQKNVCFVFVLIINGHKRIAKFFTIAKSTPFKYNNTKNVRTYLQTKKKAHTGTYTHTCRVYASKVRNSE